MKKLFVVMLLALAMAMLLTGVAFANFGPHGGYAADTDACAGCHRAHTSISSVTWNDKADGTGNNHSALLVSDATTMSQFCYACHGESAPGASTNVMTGIFDAGPSSPAGGAAIGAAGRDGVVIAYQTASSYDATLNGGGFVRVPLNNGSSYVSATSAHDMDPASAVPMWGAGSGVDKQVKITCTDCHDPHGSSNYRLLKDQVNGVAVGGYDSGDNPQPYVISAEQNYPGGGWLKHQAGQNQMVAYRPDYTSPQYGYQPPAIVNGTTKFRSMSMWCNACHTDYGDPAQGGWGETGSSNTKDYDAYEQSKNDPSQQIGPEGRHRHPVDVTLAAGNGSNRALAAQVVTDAALPLEKFNKPQGQKGGWDYNDYIGCLTCHRAHGVETTMTGWASASYTTSAGAVVQWLPIQDPSRNGGVGPSGQTTAVAGSVGTSSLLRLKNRGVCEVCHNK